MSSQKVRVAEKLRQLELACGRHALPITPQRRAVLEALARRGDHPSADEIFADVTRTLPGISRATVYRVLATLVRLGVADRAFHPDAVARFDPVVQRHHHLFCVHCGGLSDLPDEGLNALNVPEAIKRNHEVRDFTITFHGVCAACRRRDAEHETNPESNLDSDDPKGDQA
jgi:Fur family peroxide stress response transcriptional regulator